jgi:hypothetical protein
VLSRLAETPNGFKHGIGDRCSICDFGPNETWSVLAKRRAWQPVRVSRLSQPGGTFQGARELPANCYNSASFRDP